MNSSDSNVIIINGEEINLDNIILTDSTASSGNIDINMGYTGPQNYSYIGNDTITVSNIDLGGNFWTFNETNPFEDGFPEWQDFQDMCKEYPGLEKTFEHLKAFYKLCKDDWEAKKRGEDD